MASPDIRLKPTASALKLTLTGFKTHSAGHKTSPIAFYQDSDALPTPVAGPMGMSATRSGVVAVRTERREMRSRMFYIRSGRFKVR